MKKVKIGIIGTGFTVGIANAHVKACIANEEGHKGLYNEFVGAILDGYPVRRTLKRGLYIQKILEALKKSADEGRTIKV